MKNLPLLVVLIAIACSAPKKESVNDPLVASIDSVMNSAADTARFNGNILVAKDHKVIYQKSFGLADFYNNRTLNDSSLFELASMSKAFTAMGIMMLKERGKLNYDDDVKKYIPELPYEGMTIRHFLNHTSGIADYESLFISTGWDVKKIAHNDDIIKMFAEKKPAVNFKPGEKWEYSNTAYALLASIIERVSGEKYGTFLSENIFVPLEMKRSRTYNTRRSGEVIDNYAYGFIYSDSLKTYALPDSLKEYFYVYPLDGIEGDGIVNSTTGDLFKWNEALYTDKLVSKATLEEAFTSGKTNSDSVYNYGFGWMVANDGMSGKITQHSGSWPGYRTLIVRFVDHGDCIIILSNTENPNARTSIGKELKKRLERYRNPKQGT